jgi:PhnB protein
MQLNNYLTFNGDCETAFKFYERCLGGKIEMMMSHGDSPMADQTPAEWRSRIMHARMSLGKDTLMGSDAPPNLYQRPAGFSVSLILDSPAEAERIFQALAENGEVRMPIQQTFWSVRFGMVTDRFGIPWMVNCEQPT